MQLLLKRKKLLSAVAAASVGSIFGSHVRGVVPEYTILDLSTLGGGTSEANGINNAGRIIGTSQLGNGARRAFLTSPSAAINPATDAIPTLGGSVNTAYGINASGQIAGWSNTGSTEQAYRYSGGTIATNLGSLGGNNSYGQAINNLGQVVGSAYLDGHGSNFPTHAMLYSGSTMYDLGTLANDSFAYGISSAGVVVGYYQAGSDRAFRWTPNVANGTAGSMVDIGDLGGSYSYAYGINDSGQIVGESTLPGDDNSHAYLLNPGGTMSDLGTLGGASSKALSINTSGTIVGSAGTGSATHAFAYIDGMMRDLNSLIPGGSTWTLTKATSVNDLGQIVGVGTVGTAMHGFLITPVPTWAVDNNGNWSTSSNWLGGVPSGIGAEVRLTGAISAARTITLDSPRTVGHLVFDNAFRYTIAGTSMLTINGSSPTTGIEVRSGGHTIAAPVNFASAATISLAASSGLSLTGKVSGAVKSLQLGSSATLDLADNNLVIDYTGSGPIAAIAAALATGRNGGQWNGTGINSSVAASVAASPTSHKTALAYAEASTLGISVFAGQPVDPTSLLIRYTYNGDANLDGAVNALDFNAMAANYGTGSRRWDQGDFNYDGNVDLADFTLMGTNFGLSAAPALGSLVPEPTILLPVFAFGFFQGARRARRRA